MAQDSPEIMFTGITGLLGKYFSKRKVYKVWGIADKTIPDNLEDFFKVDITDKEQTLDFVKKTTPGIIVHAASIGNVDYCEKNPDEAYKVNVEGTKNIIEAAKLVNAKLIFISSNAVYGGVNPPYAETAGLNPVDVYGKTKAEGERLVTESGVPFTILRLITMYGWPYDGGRKNPVVWIIDNLRKQEKINVVNDIYNNHLWAGQAADATRAAVEKEMVGESYNIGGAECLSRYDLALRVAKIFDLDSSLISSVNSDFFKEIAKRPKNTCFDTSKMEKDLGVKPLSVDEGLRLMRKEEVDN